MQWESAFFDVGVAMRSFQMTLGGLVINVILLAALRGAQGSGI